MDVGRVGTASDLQPLRALNRANLQRLLFDGLNRRRCVRVAKKRSGHRVVRMTTVGLLRFVVKSICNHDAFDCGSL